MAEGAHGICHGKTVAELVDEPKPGPDIGDVFW